MKAENAHFWRFHSLTNLNSCCTLYCTIFEHKTHKIQIIDSNRNKEQGNAKDTRTSTGLELSIAFNEEWLKHYDSVQVYRISYVEPNNPPEIYLIYDGDANKDFKIVDKGNDELQKLSLDEFSALDSQIIIPQSIESN